MRKLFHKSNLDKKSCLKEYRLGLIWGIVVFSTALFFAILTLKHSTKSIFAIIICSVCIGIAFDDYSKVKSGEWIVDENLRLNLFYNKKRNINNKFALLMIAQVIQEIW